MLKETDNFLTRVTQALNRPMQSRCAELTVLVDRGSIRDLQSIFPLLIDSIFGAQGTVNWDLRSITTDMKNQDSQALQHFLSAQGAMFRLIYKLLREPQIKFEFSLTYLPTKLRQSLDPSHKHNMFYSDLLYVNPQTNQIMSLVLNPFDYYFFHFAYYLINPWHQRSINPCGIAWNSVYYILCCDYVLHFLPTNPYNRVSPIIDFYNGKNPAQVLQVLSRPPKISKLLRQSVYSDAVNNFNSTCHLLEHNPRKEIWRSETVMTVFIDMWLNNDQIIQTNQGFQISPSQFSELPTGEYVRIIRVLVKQLHAFSSSGKIDDMHMGELKKIAMSCLQEKMYVFLRNIVHRWPLDGSFRLVLELWLSFIQPWRYPGNDHLKSINQQEVNPDIEETSIAPMRAVDREHMPFMANNLLAYTVIFQQLLPRFTRVDLSSPKNSLMLYRLTKVFNQPNLVSFLREIENCVENLNPSQIQGHSAWSTGLPPLSPTSNWSTNIAQSFNNSAIDLSPKRNLSNGLNNSPLNDSGFRNIGSKWSNVIKQKIYELEGPNFCYKSVFTAVPAQEVFDLLWHIKKAEQTAQAIVQMRVDEINKQSSGFWGELKSLFSTFNPTNDEFTLDDRRKVPIYLNSCIQNALEIFHITDFENSAQSSTQEDSLRLSPQRSRNDFQYLLTPERVRARVKHITYEGDPDLHPVRSNENKFLVRVLYQLALKINHEFSQQLYTLYYQENYIGRLSREVLCAPITIYRYDKTSPGRSPRVSENLPPRISFRFFASHKFLVYMAIGIVFSNLLGHKTSTFVLFVGLVWLFYIGFRAMFSNTQRLRRVNDVPRIADLSFNESF